MVAPRSTGRKVLPTLAVIAIAGVSVWVVAHVFRIRFATGGDHPRLSTLSAQPQGARACFEALDGLPSIVADRNFLPLDRFKERAGTTLVFAGANGAFFGPDSVKNFELVEGWMHEGLDIVAALDARSVPAVIGTANAKDPWERTRLDFGPVEGGDDEEDERVLPTERWNFSFDHAGATSEEETHGSSVTLPHRAGVRTPAWFSEWRWKTDHADWATLATVDVAPVIVRRSFGAGSLTLCTDATFLTNEALWRAPRPGFVLWLLGQKPRVVFDETLHGSAHDPGIMHILRENKLLGFFVGAAVLLGLLVWRSATTLAPVHPTLVDGGVRGVSGGAASQAGMANLFSQAIKPAALLRTCFTEWARSPFVRRQVPQERVAAVRDMTVAAEAGGGGGRDVVATYRRIRDFLVRRG